MPRNFKRMNGKFFYRVISITGLNTRKLSTAWVIEFLAFINGPAIDPWKMYEVRRSPAEDHRM